MNETFVQIETGLRAEAGYVKNDRFWEAGSLRKDGTPDRRKPGHQIGLKKLISGDISGAFVPLNEDTELMAEPHRARIAKLEAELRQAKRALREYYFDRQLVRYY